MSKTDVLEEYLEDNPEAEVFINIGNGIEAIPYLDSIGKHYSFADVRSSHLEDGASNLVLLKLPPDLLMGLACGRRCVIVDTGARKDYSRAIWQGVPFIKVILEKIWYDKNAVSAYTKPRRADAVAVDELPLYRQWMHDLDRTTFRYLKRFRPYAKKMGGGEVKLDGISWESDASDNTDNRIDILEKHFAN